MRIVERKYPWLFSPLKVGKLTLKNRIEAPPVNISNLPLSGYPTADNIAIFEEKAKGGAAIVHMGECRIDRKTGISHLLCIALDDPEVIPYLHAATDAIKRHNAFSAVELIHPGTRSDPAIYDGPIWGPSAGPGHLGKDYQELDKETIKYIVGRFGDAAEVAKLGGVDIVMIHAGHGWLLHQFLSPLNNRRTDEYGGSLENRARITMEVIEDIRRKCGPDMPIEVRISGTELTEGGLTLEDQIEFAKLLDGKVDLLHVTCGTFHVPETNQHMIPNGFLPDGCNVYLAEAIKKQMRYTPVVTVGALSDPQMMEDIIAEGKADMVALGRALIADPQLPNKLKEGREDEVSPCLRCMACISENFVPYVRHCSRIRRCPANPAAYKELAARDIRPAEKPKKVLVIGGGPAGMEAAAGLAERGHRVILCEKSSKLGGAMLLASRMPFKFRVEELRKVMIRRLEASGTEIRLNCEVTDEVVELLSPDVIVAAMGARPHIPEWLDPSGYWVNASVSSPVQAETQPEAKKGKRKSKKAQAEEADSSIILNKEPADLKIQFNRGNAMSYEHALRYPESIGQSVVIAGSGLTGLELALWLAKEGRQVVVAGRAPAPCLGAAYLYREGLLMELQAAGVNILNSVECLGMNEAGVLLKPLQAQDAAKACSADQAQDPSEGCPPEQPQVIAFPADSLIAACGMDEAEIEAERFRFQADDFWKIGDCAEVRKIFDARREGYNAGAYI